jgi:hypothetical protein
LIGASIDQSTRRQHYRNRVAIMMFFANFGDAARSFGLGPNPFQSRAQIASLLGRAALLATVSVTT